MSIDFGSILNPYAALVALGVAIGGATFGIQFAADQRQEDALLALHSKIVESTLINEYMDEKMVTLIKEVESASNTLTAGQLLRDQRKAYRDELVTQFDLPKVKMELQRALERTTVSRFEVSAGQIIGILLVGFGFFGWLSERRRHPPVSP